MKTIQRFCPVCQQVRPHEKERLNHVLHFFLGLFTCGLWWLLWPLLAAARGLGSYRCAFCGHAAH